MFDRRTMLRASGVALASGLAGCGGSSSETETADGTTVEMTDDLAFVPAELTVSVGDTVTWENTGSVAHSVTAYEDQLPDGATYFASGDFESESAAREGWTNQKGRIEGGESYEHTLETAGEFQYFCVPHKGMEGTIVVES